MMPDRLVTVARFNGYIEAELARQLLENYGIKSVVTGQNVAALYAGVPAAIDVELQTFQSQAEQAGEILKSQERQEQ